MTDDRAPASYNGHIDADCEVYRGVGAFCTCQTPEEKAADARERAECEAERDERDRAPASAETLETEVSTIRAREALARDAFGMNAPYLEIWRDVRTLLKFVETLTADLDIAHALNCTIESMQVERMNAVGGLEAEVTALRAQLAEALAKAERYRLDCVYHSDCRPNRHQAEAWRDDAKAMNDKWADEVKARRDAEAQLTQAREALAQAFGDLSSSQRERCANFDAIQTALTQARDVLRWLVEQHGPWHTSDCPADDTCDCAAKPYHDAINALLAHGDLVTR